MQTPTSIRFISVFAGVLFYCVSFATHAARIDNLYEAMVPVTSQDSQLRDNALRRVLQAVAIKVSGQNNLPAYFSAPELPVQHLVEQFGYESLEKQDGQRQLYFWARLNTLGVQHMLREHNLPVWPEERPATLIWLALQDKNGQQIIAERSSHAIIKLIQKLADERGLPVILPLMDLNENIAVNFTDITMMVSDHLSAISEKYASQYMLIGHVQQESEALWRGHWLVTGSTPFTTPAGTLEDVVTAAVNSLTNEIAQKFASFSHNDNPQYIEITADDIQSADDYAKTLNYLKSISLVNQVDVVSLNQARAYFRLHTRADIATLLQIIRIDRVLFPRDAIDELIYGINP